MSDSFWDARYGGADYAYGTEPNDLVRDEAARIPAGPVLCLAEGEGRNAVFLAGRGHDVTAMDRSTQGLRKATALAAARGVPLTVVEGDLATFDLGTGWSAIVSIWAHTPPEVRRPLHARIAAALAPGGVFVLEAYTPAQLAHDTGGPKDLALLMTLDGLRAELTGLELAVGREVERVVREGAFHDGPSATVQVVARKPSASTAIRPGG